MPLSRSACPVVPSVVLPAALPASPAVAVPIVVLDSNVWIDILVFDDPHTRPIHAALEQGRLHAVVDAPCLYELTRVLDYPQFSRFAVDREAALARVARLSRGRESLPTAVSHVTLPKCTDRDDQKFLELAAGVCANWLVTKDKALLKLAKRFFRDHNCRIERPPGFVSATLTAPARATD